ncbi:MAG TPA: hypothetical protein VD793_01735 [Gemmatimonadales bacterium]|nr:hypothetical protein [Gemmatimonadales bacterium]
MDAKALKEEARALEQQGNIAEALDRYRQVIDSLDSTTSILRELPLFVKVGDLSAKVGDVAGAVTSYQRAAEQYADHGSAQSVVALCVKVLRLDPRRTRVYLDMARRMVAAGHVEPARGVLLDFAERSKQQRVTDALKRVAGRSNEEVQATVQQVIEAVDRSLKAREAAGGGTTPAPPTKAPAPPPASPAAPAAAAPRSPMLEDHLVKLADDAPSSKRPLESSISSMPKVQLTPDWDPEPGKAADQPASASAVPAAPPPPIPPPAPPSARSPAPPAPEPPPVIIKETPWAPPPPAAPPPVFAAPPPSAPAAPPAPPAPPPAPPPTPRRMSEPAPVPAAEERTPPWRGPSGAASPPASDVGTPQVFQAQPSRKRALPVRWIGVGAGLAVAAAVGFLLMGGESSGTGTDSVSVAAAPPPAPPPSATPVPAESLVAQDTLVAEASGLLAAADTLPAEETEPTAEPAAEVPPAPAAPAPAVIQVSGPVIRIEGLVVESVTEINEDERTGYTVVQLLGDGQRLTLVVVPRAAATDTLQAGQIRVQDLGPAGARGAAVFGTFLVSAEGPLPSDRLESLLCRLIEAPIVP